MKTEAIIKRVSEIPAGRFFRVRYTTKVKLKAEYEKQGYSILKIVDTTTRTGVKYKNIAGVKLNDYPDEYEPKKTNWEWVVKDRIKHNTNTGKDYLVVAPISNGSNTVVSYVLTTPEGVSNTIPQCDVKSTYSVPSYWKNGDKPVIMNITLENVLMVK
jgi:hypothetical protein